jgi:ribulose-phosphate 3-epimerase
MMEKVAAAKAWKKANGGTYDIQVDGGINAETAKLSIDNGANVLVAGTSIFRTPDYADAIRALRGS